jgi:Tol biopolymer transport system component
MLRVAFVAALTLGLAAPAPAAAQYFGRNKVQYERFDFKILRTAHFDIYYYPEAREAAVLAARMSERWYSRLSRVLDHRMNGRQPLILYASHPHFEQTNALSGELGESTGGATEVFKRRIVLPFGATLAETDHVLGHEIVHAFQYDITGQGRSVQTGGIPGALFLPLWFIEGMAEYLSVGPDDALTAMWLRDAMSGELPTLYDLGNGYKWFPYRWGQAFWAWIAGTYGDEVVGRMLKIAGRARQPEVAIAAIVGLTPKALAEQWHASMREHAEAVRTAARPASDFGREVFPDSDALYHLAPALSPDGQRIAFISERGQFSIDIYLADVATGRVIRRITRTSVDAHFESLQFIASAGSFGPEGRTFALSGVVRGQPVITFLDVASGDHIRELRFPEMGEIYNPSISPDGNLVAFSALIGGHTDLFVYDLTTDALRRLTNDPYADLQPAWAPDGQRLAWVTDRWGTDLDLLTYGATRVGTFDLASGSMAPATEDGPGRQINPQWSPDGDVLWFVGDAEGVNDVYRARVADGVAERVTTVQTGVSGITRISPALSVASRTGEVAFSIYHHDGYRVFIANPDSLVAQGPVPYAGLRPSALPPVQRVGAQVEAMLADAETGLPDTLSFATENYGARLGLDYVAQPSLAIAGDQFGTFVGGGAAVYWSDMLGDHNLATILQINGSLRDVIGVVGYTNTRQRLNWGVVVQQVPLLYQQYGAGTGSIGGIPVYVEQLRRLRQTNRDVAGLLSYPFNRVSRIEAQAGYRNIHFSDEIETRFYELVTLQQVAESTVTLPTFPSMHLATSSIAHVYDNSLYGASAPLIGRRSRFEIASVLGTINYFTGLADVRNYFMPVRPFTFATRLVHYGRYGSGAEDSRISPLFLGSSNLVRGYDNRSFDIAECIPEPGDACPLFNRLIGTRLAVAKAELRFPILGALGVGSGFYGVLPVDVGVFGDAGLAWRDDIPETAADEGAFFLGGDRRPLTSAGGLARMNFFGFMIIEANYAYAFQRGKWLWQFSFQPGF